MPGNALPIIASMSPTSALAGSADLLLDVEGNNFISSSYIEMDESQKLTTTYISSTELTATIPASSLSDVSTVELTVVTPAPGGGVTAGLFFTISAIPIPSITGISPGTIVEGSTLFTVTVNGSNFTSSSVVQWNGSALPSTFISSSELTATVASSLTAVPTTGDITVANGASPSLVSNGAALSIGFEVRPVAQPANDMLWDPVHSVIYLSIPSLAVNGNSILAFDPSTLAETGLVFAGSEPDKLAISDDGSYLYAGLDGSDSVQRFTLPSLVSDINIPLGVDSTFGPYFALDLAVAPGNPHTIAVSNGISFLDPLSEGGITIYDDATPRADTVIGHLHAGITADSLQWGADASTLYTVDNEDTGLDFYPISVDASGATLGTGSFSHALQAFYSNIYYDSANGLVYADDGAVIDPATQTTSAPFAVSDLAFRSGDGLLYVQPGLTMTFDSALNRAYFIGQTSAEVTAGAGEYTLRVFDLTTHDLINSAHIYFPGPSAGPVLMKRWGSDGLAINTNVGLIYLIDGDIVTQ